MQHNHIIPKLAMITISINIGNRKFSAHFAEQRSDLSRHNSKLAFIRMIDRKFKDADKIFFSKTVRHHGTSLQ